MVQTEPRKRYVDGSKVQEHHAIIPTKQVPTESALAKMDDLQRKIYALVVKTTVAMFLPDYLYEETKIQTKVADLLFQSIGKTPKQEGWKILFKQQTKEKRTFKRYHSLSLANVPKLVLRVLKKKRNRQKLLQRVHY